MKKLFPPVSKVCTGAFAAKEAEVRNKTYIFDWSGQSYKSTAYILDNGVDKLFDNAERVDNAGGYFGEHTIWDDDYKMLLLHEKSEDDIEFLKKKYKRSYDSTIKAIKEAEWICLIQSTMQENTIDDHLGMVQAKFEGKLPIGENLDDNSVECVVESIKRINPQAEVYVTKYHDKFMELVEELKKLK